MALTKVTQTGGPAARDEVRQLVNQLAILVTNAVSSTLSAVAIGTTKSKVKTTNTVTYRVNGKSLSKAGTDDLWTLSGTVVAAVSWQKYLLLLDASGTASIIEGVQSTVAATSVVLPALPQDKSVIGVLTVATAAATTFTPGTTLLDAAGITATYQDGFDPSSLFTVSL